MNPIELTETEQSPIQILEGYSDGYARAKFLITTVDVSNRNGRTYPRSLAERETRMQFAGRVLGQSKHPQSERDILDQFIVWESATLEGDDEYFIAKIIPTQKGKDFTEIAKAGAMVATSRVGAGELKEGVDKNGKKTNIVNPETYHLVGADVLYPGVQSNASSMHIIHFEAYDPKESNSMEMTSEKLREEHPEIVTEIEAAALQPVQAQVAERDAKIAELEGQVTQVTEQVTNLTAEKESAVKLAEETQSKLAPMSEQIATLTAAQEELNAKLAEATTQVAAFTEQVAKLQEAAQAHAHLIEKVQTERAGWLIYGELKNEVTVADVDAKFETAKQKCDALLENAGIPAGRTAYTGNENDEVNKANRDAAEKKRQETLEKSKRIAQHAHA